MGRDKLSTLHTAAASSSCDRGSVRGPSSAPYNSAIREQLPGFGNRQSGKSLFCCTTSCFNSFYVAQMKTPIAISNGRGMLHWPWANRAKICVGGISCSQVVDPSTKPHQPTIMRHTRGSSWGKESNTLCEVAMGASFTEGTTRRAQWDPKPSSFSEAAPIRPKYRGPRPGLAAPTGCGRPKHPSVCDTLVRPRRARSQSRAGA